MGTLIVLNTLRLGWDCVVGRPHQSMGPTQPGIQVQDTPTTAPHGIQSFTHYIGECGQLNVLPLVSSYSFV